MFAKTLIIAEMAGTHDGELKNIIKLIRVAKAVGADAVKTQWCSDIQSMAARRKLSDPSVYKLLNFPESWHKEIVVECHKQELDYICSVFLPKDVSVVAQHANKLKIASLEVDDSQLRKVCLDTGKELIISTGCMSKGELQKLFMITLQYKMFILHSTSAYPVPIGETNLSLISQGFDGYSDQTGRILTGALAVMAGARIIEVHFCLYETDSNNPDYAHSLDPSKLGQYIKYVRLAEKEKGDGIKKIEPSEMALVKHRVIS